MTEAGRPAVVRLRTAITTAAMAITRRLPLALALLLVVGLATGAPSPKEDENPCENVVGAVDEDGECVCEDADDVIDSSGTKCLRVAFGGHSAECEDTRQCTQRMGEGAECVDDACACADGFHYLHGRCWADKSYGEACDDHAQCYSFSESDSYACVEDTCSCAVDAVPKRPTETHPLCRRIAREGEECESNVDCAEGLNCEKYGNDLHTICTVSSGKIYKRLGNATQHYFRNSKTQKEDSPEEVCGLHEVPTPSKKDCVCEHGYFKLDDTCQPELGEPCVVGVDHADHIPNIVCRRSAKNEYVQPDSEKDDRDDDGDDNVSSENPQEEVLGVWACLGGFVAGPSNRECQKTSDFNHTCEINAQCGHNGGYCLDSLCQCPRGHDYQEDALLCLQKEDCDGIKGAIEDENGECQCKNPDYFIDGSETKCIEEAFGGYSAECEDSRQCYRRMGKGGLCQASVCVCAEGYHYLLGVCWKDIAYGERCTDDSECYAFAESDSYACVEGVCACAVEANTTRREPNPLCRPLARVGEECETNLDCGNGFTCEKPTTNSLDNVCIIDNAAAARGDSGTRSGILSLESSLQATLRRRYTKREISENSKHSTDIKVPGQPKLECGDNEILTTNLTTCVCKHGYYRLKAGLSCVPELGAPCLRGVDVADHIEYMTCRRSAKYEYAQSDSEEEEDSDDSEQDVHSTTTENSYVTTTEEPLEPVPGVWACLGGFVAAPSNRECQKTRQNGFNCEYDTQCGYYGGLCYLGSCQCEDGYHYDSNNQVCWPTAALHEVCETNTDCGVATADSVECVFDDPSNTEGICQCKSDYREVDDDCWKKAYSLNERCLVTADCVFANEDPTVICDYGYCSCISGHFASTDSTVCIIGIQGPCEDSTSCSAVENSECSELKCNCKDGFVADGSRRCLEIKTQYGDECEETDQCQPIAPDEPLLSCYYTTNTCICPPTYHFVDGHCWNTKYIDDKCDNPQQCAVEHTVCRKNYCTCDYGYVQNGEECEKDAAPPGLTGSLVTLVLVVFSTRLL